MVGRLSFRTTSFLSRRQDWLPQSITVASAAAIFLLVVFGARRSYVALGDPAVWTGWILFALILFLSLFSVRKRLPMIPLIRARWWTLLHVVAGVLALGIYAVHVGRLWPTGTYEQWLAALFYLTSLSGLIGYLFSQVYPRRLTETGVEVIYERIPGLLAEMRGRTEALILECARKTGSDTLPRFYVESLDWYMRRPRFQIDCLWGGRRGTDWVNRQDATVRRYLSKEEAPYLDELTEVLRFKNRVDFHYAVQSLLKTWLSVHVPLAVAVLVLGTWHLIVVHVYYL